MTPAEVQAKIDALFTAAASRLLGAPSDGDIRDMGEEYARRLVESGFVASARYDHATGEVLAVPLAYPKMVELAKDPQ